MLKLTHGSNVSWYYIRLQYIKIDSISFRINIERFYILYKYNPGKILGQNKVIKQNWTRLKKL